MQKSGYGLGFSAAVTAASSTIGPIFPPSVPFVIYGGITGVSVVQLFLAGVVPGLLMAAVMMVIVAVTARLRDYPREARPTLREATWAVLDGLLPLGAPALLIGGLLSGLFTPTEAGVVACAYALFLGMVVYREIGLRDIPGILWASARSTAVVMFVIAASGFFGWMLAHQRVPDELVAGLLALAPGPGSATFLMLAVLLVLGMFVEGVAIIVITTPLFMPVLAHFGIDPLQFGVMLVLTTAIGLLTPPVGMVLFAVSTVCRVNMGELVRELWPYILGIVVVTLAVAYIPAVSTLLPSLWAR
ncbi:TRAP transporter large permease [Roseomonas sp. M0104]|uniref:TRAP transporter large permease protein n=1 Tax=Teichococcus coralli TaxID=2545983 RepID=A0A845BGS8_9PROT|nr:TRAP transporter large permease [Pseudoroseomonas coralli]MXP65326.1 TRAP transporter large permease [Pseudoroseomonas coralli]